MAIDFKIYKETFKGDFSGGLTAAIISLPMGLAFGMQSGLGAAAGLYTACVLAILASVIGGTKTLISDPTGPMAIVAALVVAEGIDLCGGLNADAYAYILGTFILAGLFQIGFGFLKIAQYVKYISYPVISGFMGGIGCLIIIFQWFKLFGLDNPDGGVIGILSHATTPITSMSPVSLGLGLGTMAMIYTLPLINKKIPATLVALIIATVASVFLGGDFPTIGEINTQIPSLRFEFLSNFDPKFITSIMVNGITLAALGTIDTLLTSVVADNLTKTKHNGDLELMGQGLGNMLCGLIGGIPGAGATMGTVININNGGRSNLSGIFKGVLLVVMILGLGKFVAYIPISVLAGILMTVGIGIIDFKGMKKLFAHPQADTLILVLVLGITVFKDLLIAVAVGIVLSAFLFMKKMADVVADGSVSGELETVNRGLKIPERLQHHVQSQILDGPLFFGFTDQFKNTANTSEEGIEVVIISMHKVPFVDTSGLYALADIFEQYQSKGIDVCFVGVQPTIFTQMEDLEVIPNIIPEEKFYNKIRTCLKYLNHRFTEV